MIDSGKNPAAWGTNDGVIHTMSATLTVTHLTAGSKSTCVM